MDTISELLDIRRISLEPAAAELPRGREVLARFPGAQLVEVESHHRIPELYGDETNVRRWVRFSLMPARDAKLLDLIGRRTPYCRVRYAF